MKNLLKITFVVDAAITIGFGLYSWLAPKETFGTIVAIPEAQESLILAMLSTMSIQYILLGVLCLIGFRSKQPVTSWIGLAMVLRHVWIGLMKVLDMNQEWVIGDPVPDIVIHSVFTAAYLLGIYFFRKAQRQ